MDPVIKNVKKVKLNHPEQMSYKKAVVDLITLNGLPFNTVEGEGYIQFVSTIAPHLTVQSQRTVAKDLKEVVSQLKPKIKNLLESNIDGKSLHLTLDLWSSHLRQSIMGVRCQFIDRGWHFQNLLLCFVCFPGKHSGEEILQAVNQALAEVGVEDSQISCVCADNAGNMAKALNMQNIFPEQWWLDLDDPDLDSEVQRDKDWDPMGAILLITSQTDSEEELDYGFDNNSWERKSCVAHTLQLVINDSIEVSERAKPLLVNLQKWINFFRRSEKWTKELKSKTGGRNFKLIGGIRLSTLYFGLERFTEENMLEGMLYVFNEAKKDTETLLKMDFPFPNDNDIQDAKELLEILRPLKNSTDFFQTSGPISSKVIGALLTVFQDVFLVEPGKFLDLQMAILKNLEDQFSSTLDDPTYILASLLDPTQKTLLFESTYIKPTWSQSYPKFKCPTRTRAEVLLIERVLEEAKLLPPTIFAGNDIPKPYSPLGRLNLQTTIQKEQSSMTEAEGYLVEARCQQDDMILDYWRVHEKEFPTLARLAKRYLAVPAISADVEQMISIAGFLMQARRSGITIKHVVVILMYREYRNIMEKTPM